MLYDRRHTRLISDFRGLWKAVPILSGLFLGLIYLTAFIRNESELLIRERIAYLIGALGAVMAVTGGYLVLFPRSHITVMYLLGIVNGVVEVDVSVPTKPLEIG